MKTRIRFLITLLCAAAATVQMAHAAIIQVTNPNNSGPGTLRQALRNANDGDTIKFASHIPLVEVVLTSGELLVDKDVTITPSDVKLPVTVRRSAAPGTPSFRIFHIAPGRTVSLSSLTITNGKSDFGAGILNEQANVTVSKCVITGNSAEDFGGGIYCKTTPLGNATLTVNDSYVSNNSAGSNGGGIGIGHQRLPTGTSTVTLNDTTVSNNSAGYKGGGIYNESSREGKFSLTISNCTISGNVATGTSAPPFHFFGNGGGIYTTSTAASAGNVTTVISNSTLSGNSAEEGGGGIALGRDSQIGIPVRASINNSTISGNSAPNGGGIANITSNLQIGNTILNTGASGANIFSPSNRVTSVGYNLSNDNGGGFLTATGDQINTNPKLSPLDNHGGPTLTHRPLDGSPAIDMGDPRFSPPPEFDQRGPRHLRVVNGRLDIGAIEVQRP
jgi:predicted outer membrane repeat protein